MILTELAPIIRVTWQRLENITAQELKIDGDCMHAYVTVLMCIVDAVTLVGFFLGAIIAVNNGNVDKRNLPKKFKPLPYIFYI